MSLECNKKVDELSKKYMVEKGCSYAEAVAVILDENPQLAKSYIKETKQLPKMSSPEDDLKIYETDHPTVKAKKMQAIAGRDLDNEAKLMMLKYNLSYSEAFSHVLLDPKNYVRVNTYLNRG